MDALALAEANPTDAQEEQGTTAIIEQPESDNKFQQAIASWRSK